MKKVFDSNQKSKYNIICNSNYKKTNIAPKYYINSSNNERQKDTDKEHEVPSKPLQHNTNKTITTNTLNPSHNLLKSSSSLFSSISSGHKSSSKYVHLGNLGEGSYGLVMKCQDTTTGQLVAIKKFIESEEDKLVKKIALREIHLLKQLRHPNLVNLLEVFRRKQRLYLVFEFVDKTLLDLLEASDNGMPKNDIKIIIYQIILALEFCHIHNIIHRDVKPENILISKTGVVKLCDFGFARVLAKESTEVYTEYVATRWYRAPELLVAEARYDRAVDIWALGCLYCEMSSGHPLFPGDSDVDQLFNIVKCLGSLCSRHEKKIRDAAIFPFEFSKIPVTCPLESKVKNCSKLEYNFIKICLSMDPKARPTCSQLLQHPLFDEGGFKKRFEESFGAMIRSDLREPAQKPKRRMLPDLSKIVAAQSSQQATQHNNLPYNDIDPRDNKVFNLAFKTFSSSSSSQLASSSLSSSSSECNFNYDTTLVSVIKDEEDKINLAHNNTSSSNSNSNKENKMKENDKFNMSKLKTELKYVHNNSNSIATTTTTNTTTTNNNNINNNNHKNNNPKMPANIDLGKSIKRHVSRGNTDTKTNNKNNPNNKNKNIQNKKK